MPLGTVHRNGVSNCPHCDFEPEKSWKVWPEHAVSMVLNEVQCKHGSVAYISECPKCFKKSWVHHEIAGFDHSCERWPKGWPEAAKAEGRARALSNLRSCQGTLCMSCVHLVGVQIDTIAWRWCKPKEHGWFETECNAYKKGQP